MVERIFPNTLIPKTAVLEMTYRCNHRCVFCSAPWENKRRSYPQEKEMSIREWKHCVDILANKGVRNFAFSGGEPLLKDELKELILYAAHKKVPVPVFAEDGSVQGHEKVKVKLHLITNGALVNDPWIELFKQFEMTLIVSLPGRNAFREMTGGGDFERTLSTIRNLSKAELDVVMSICVTKRNLPELFETISLGFLSGAHQLLLNRFLPGGRGMEYPELCLDRHEVVDMLDIAEEACRTANRYGSVGTELPKCIIPQDRKYTLLTVGTLCSGGVDFFAVDPSGRVRPCNHSPVVCGHVQDLESAVSADYWQRFKCKSFLPKECSGCGLSMQCDGGCREAAHLVNGSLDSVEPVFSSEPLGLWGYR